jgi:hypothetical protein
MGSSNDGLLLVAVVIVMQLSCLLHAGAVLGMNSNTQTPQVSHQFEK